MNRQTGETFEESYDTLILSPGAGANNLGFDSNISFNLRNLEDTDAIDQFILITMLKCVGSRCWLYITRSY